MAKHIAEWGGTLLLCASLGVVVGCGGGQGNVDAPDGETTDDAAPDGDGTTPTPEPPKDGIVRDADGDGVPDDTSDRQCTGKNETACKINSSCAWNDQGQCVDAKSSPM